jgi:hypothetical protein
LVKAGIKNIRLKIRMQYQRIYTVLFELYPNVFSYKRQTIGSFMWAAAVVFSRAFDLGLITMSYIFHAFFAVVSIVLKMADLLCPSSFAILCYSLLTSA